MSRRVPLLKAKCGTCPFRDGSPYAYLKDGLAESAMSEASRICHSTGSNNGINRVTGKPAALCRGARDVQLATLHRLGFLNSPTDEAWNAKCAELGIEPDQQNLSRRPHHILTL